MIIRQGTATVVTWGPLIAAASTQQPVLGIQPTCGEVQLLAPGTSPRDLEAAAINHVGHGMYAIGLTALDTSTVGTLSIIGYRPGVYRPCRADFLVVAQVGNGADRVEHPGAPTTAGDQEAAAPGFTFAYCAEAYLIAHGRNLRDRTHRRDWRMTIDKYLLPAFGAVPVQDVDVEMVLQVIETWWEIKPKRANKVRGRIEAILDWAAAQGFRDGPNPARWRGHLDRAFPKPRKLQPVRTHPALDFREIGAFIEVLRAQPIVRTRALEFMILTAARKNDLTRARWTEMDLAQQVWTIPGERTRGDRPHRVPLSARAIEILEHMAEIRVFGHAYVFPGRHLLKPLGHSTFYKLMVGPSGPLQVSLQGFRTTFKDWATLTTDHEHQVIEISLGHRIGTDTHAAYRRGDLLEKRRLLMDEWGLFCGKPYVARVGRRREPG